MGVSFLKGIKKHPIWGVFLNQLVKKHLLGK